MSIPFPLAAHSLVGIVRCTVQFLFLLIQQFVEYQMQLHQVLVAFDFMAVRLDEELALELFFLD